MLKLSGYIEKIMAELRKEGYACFVVGGAVRDVMAGEKPWDWDLATDAPLGNVLKIFPKATVISEELSVVRIRSAEKEKNDEADLGYVDVARLRKEKYAPESFGIPSEIIFTDSIESDLERRDFTVNAMACSVEGKLIDPYGGAEDVSKRVLKMVGEPLTRLEEDPVRILRAIRLVAERNYSFSGSLQRAIAEKADLLMHISKDRVRDEFVRIVTGENAAKAIEAAEGTGVLKWVTGIDKPLKRLNPLQMLDSDRYLNISERNAATLKDYRILLSLCVFYRRYFEEDALEAVEYLNYSGKTAKVIKDAIMTGNRLSNISDKFELKEYIAEYGFEFYDLMEDVLRIEEESDSKAAKMRRARLEAAAEIQRENEPLTIKDLAVNGDDITKLGATGKTVGMVLEHLAKQVRRNPEINDREKLLKIAEEMMKWNLK